MLIPQIFLQFKDASPVERIEPCNVPDVAFFILLQIGDIGYRRQHLVEKGRFDELILLGIVFVYSGFGSKYDFVLNLVNIQIVIGGQSLPGGIKFGSDH